MALGCGAPRFHTRAYSTAKFAKLTVLLGCAFWFGITWEVHGICWTCWWALISAVHIRLFSEWCHWSYVLHRPQLLNGNLSWTKHWSQQVWSSRKIASGVFSWTLARFGLADRLNPEMEVGDENWSTTHFHIGMLCAHLAKSSRFVLHFFRSVFMPTYWFI